MTDLFFFRFATLHRQQACEEFLANVERHAMKSWSWDEPGKKISRKDDDVLVEKGFLVPVCHVFRDLRLPGTKRKKVLFLPA